jgi:hypothetical protein
VITPRHGPVLRPVVSTAAWTWLVVVQLIMLVATVVGWFTLWLPAVLRAWTSPYPSTISPTKMCDRWTWPINFVYGNPEEGVSGKCAKLIGGADYMPGAQDWWRAYLWSAWRNSADNLKYVFAWQNGPFKTWTYTLLGKTRTAKAGWQLENGIKVPVLSPG